MDVGLEGFLWQPLSDLLRDWPSCFISSAPLKPLCRPWCFSTLGALKLNFDRLSFGNPGPVGFGCIIRDHAKILWVVCVPLGVYDSIKVEVVALVMGLREIEDMEVRGCLVEGDSKVVVQWGLKRSLGSWHLAHPILEIGCLMKMLKRVHYSWVFSKVPQCLVRCKL